MSPQPELFKNFKEHSVAEFFKKNRQMLGLFGKIRSLTTIVHEFVTNSIDACEEANILPTIEIKIRELGEEYYEMHFIDNGPGIPKDKIGKALGKLLAGTKFHRLIQTRGQQGIGASGCILFSQVTTGQPVKIVSGTGGKPHYVELTIDTAKNEPKIHKQCTLDKEFKGLAIKAKYKDIIYKDGPQSPLEYLKRIAIANPHTTIKFQEPSGKIHLFERTTEKMPKIPTEVKPHIKSASTDEFLQLIKSSSNKSVITFMKENYDRVGTRLISDIQKLLDFDLSKLTKRMIDWDKTEKIIKAIQKSNTIAPKTDSIIPIEEQFLKKSIINIVNPESLAVLTRKPAVYRGGYPFQVEVAIAYGGNAGRTLKTNGDNKLDIMRFANRAPLLFDSGSCAITKAVQSIDWKRYNIRDIDHLPLTIIANISSVHIPFTSAGKQAIADESEITNEIRQAFMQAARTISTYISRKKKLQVKQEKQKIFYRYGEEISDALAFITKRKKDDINTKLKNIIHEKLAIEEIEEKITKSKEKSGLIEDDPDPFVNKSNNGDEKTEKEKKLKDYFE